MQLLPPSLYILYCIVLTQFISDRICSCSANIEDSRTDSGQKVRRAVTIARGGLIRGVAPCLGATNARRERQEARRVANNTCTSHLQGHFLCTPRQLSQMSALHASSHKCLHSIPPLTNTCTPGQLSQIPVL